MEAVYQLGIDLALFLQGLGDWLYVPMRFFSLLAEEYALLLAIPVLYWCVNAQWGLRLGVYMMISGAFNGVLKLLFHGPRPFWMDTRVKSHVFESSFGIPSGHSQNSVVIFGTLAAWINKTWAWVTAGVIVFLVGLSRIYLGAHFITDVLAGWLIGALLLWALFKWEKPFLDWLSQKRLSLQVLVTFGASLSFILLALLINFAFSGWEIPTEWVENARLAYPDETMNPLSISGIVTYAAVLFGISAGALWLYSRGGFDAGGPVGKRILRLLIGLVGTAVFYLGLDLIFPEGESAIALALRYLRYGLVGFWIGGLAPMIFVALKLAERKKPA